MGDLDLADDSALHIRYAHTALFQGETISLAMAAEYIRHLRSGTHRRRSGEEHHLMRQAVERTLRLRDRRRRYMRIGDALRNLRAVERDAVEEAKKRSAHTVWLRAPQETPCDTE